MKNLPFSLTAKLMLCGLCVMLLGPGCKKDDSPTTPQGPTVSYGSGTVTATSSAGALSITGAGVWPVGPGPSVIAMYDTTVHAFFVYGYQQVSGSHYNVVAVVAFMPEPDTGTYRHPNMVVAVAYNADTTLHGDTLAYGSQSGSITMNSVSGSSASGTYSVMARKGTGPAIQFTGTFNVTYVVGVMPERSPAVFRRASLPPER